jgi:hypothetical protein
MKTRGLHVDCSSMVTIMQKQSKACVHVRNMDPEKQESIIIYYDRSVGSDHEMFT